MNKNLKIILSLTLGLILSSGVVFAASLANANQVSYTDNANLSATNVQDAIDNLMVKTKTNCPDGYRCIKTIVAAYTYNSSSCITGEESTCVETSCYENKTSGSCPAGTIIKYKVNDSTTKYFHVLHDDGETMTLQQRENTVYNNTAWHLSNDNYLGPDYALSKLESATSGWTNVNDQTYTMGTTIFKTNKFTGCSSYSYCDTNTYTLAKRTAKARMITIQESAILGCTTTSKSCPNWMYNYLNGSTSYGGTVNGKNFGYWTMSAYSSSTDLAWMVTTRGDVSTGSTYDTSASTGVRAVVVVNK